MKILHYTLGFPPYRSGGLTKYATDLMLNQIKVGYEVSCLWPGKIGVVYKKTKIKKNKEFNSIKSYEIINPLPVPLLNGINNIEIFTQSCDKGVYEKFLRKLAVDVIHVHTLMGIHKEFFQAAKELDIKIVYTTHDYFGLCPKVNFIYDNRLCDKAIECENCNKCNETALSKQKIAVLQSSLYRNIKSTELIKKLRSIYKNKEANKEVETINNVESINKWHNSLSKEDYLKLRLYYIDIFNMVDMFHFNSSVSKEIYEKYIKINKFKIIPIIHNSIKDNRKIKMFDEKLRLTYLGPITQHKGYYLLKEVLDNIYEKGYKNLELNIYKKTNNISPYMNVNDEYFYEELEGIFDRTDLLVVPSIWYETFGFVVLEGLSYGVPVLMTELVGAKDIIENKTTGIIIKNDVDEIEKTIIEIYKSREILNEINRNIVCNNNIILDYKIHLDKITELYEESV